MEKASHDLFSPFSKASYPCFLLDDGFICISYNEAAKKISSILCKKRALLSLIESRPSFPRILKSGAPVSIQLQPPFTEQSSTLSILPIKDGYLCTVEPAASHAASPPVDLLSRQLREPMSAIFSYLPMLSHRISGNDSALEYVDAISRSCYSLLRTTDNLSIVARSGSSETQFTQPCDISSLTESVCQAADTICSSYGVPIHWSVEEGIICNTSDYLYCTALSNLLLNSLTYTRDGNEVSVILSSEKNQAHLTVSDKGLGIKPEVISHIFTPYYSCDPYNDGEPAPSFGLGLTVAKCAFEGGGGSIIVNSTFGEGTTVAASLPLYDSSRVPLASHAADYLLNRFSAVYIQLSSICLLPNIF